MIVFLGWLAFIVGGGYVAFVIGALVVGIGGGGLETLPTMIASAVICAVCWIAFAIWLSPVTISFQ